MAELHQILPHKHAAQHCLVQIPDLGYLLRAAYGPPQARPPPVLQAPRATALLHDPHSAPILQEKGPRRIPACLRLHRLALQVRLDEAQVGDGHQRRAGGRRKLAGQCHYRHEEDQPSAGRSDRRPSHQ